MRLPNFSLDEYRVLLQSLKDVGYDFCPLTVFVSYSGRKVVYLRHDIDLHLAEVDQMAEIEMKLDVKATYYVLLTSHYNVLSLENQRILRRISSMGHEIGLHYDMETYPEDDDQARRHLDDEAALLSKVTGKLIRTISMHQPHKGLPDPFRQIGEYVHPHDPRSQRNMVYISDSCRAWRDESLLTCFGEHAPQCLMLSVHPELWLDGTILDRFAYLRSVLLENGLSQSRRYFLETVRGVWEQHHAPRLHNAREASQSKK